MANGRAASLEPYLRGAAKMLGVVEISGRAGAGRILAAAELDEAEFEALFGGDIETRRDPFRTGERLPRRRETRRFGALTLTERNLAVEATLENAKILARGAATFGIDRLGWSKAQRQLRERVAFLREAFAGGENPGPT